MSPCLSRSLQSLGTAWNSICCVSNARHHLTLSFCLCLIYPRIRQASRDYDPNFDDSGGEFVLNVSVEAPITITPQPVVWSSSVAACVISGLAPDSAYTLMVYVSTSSRQGLPTTLTFTTSPLPPLEAFATMSIDVVQATGVQFTLLSFFLTGFFCSRAQSFSLIPCLMLFSLVDTEFHLEGSRQLTSAPMLALCSWMLISLR